MYWCFSKQGMRQFKARTISQLEFGVANMILKASIFARYVSTRSDGCKLNRRSA